MRFSVRSPAREFHPPPGRAFFSPAVEDYAVLSARVRREIESALREARPALGEAGEVRHQAAAPAA